MNAHIELPKHLDPSSEQDDVVVSVRNVSKKFCRNLRRSMFYGIKDLSQNLLGFKPDTTTLRRDEFWALDNINIENEFKHIGLSNLLH